MSKARGERPQLGNKHQITYFQHVIPVRTISRFCNFKGSVEIIDKSRSISRQAKPKDKIFCAYRSWDERSEHGFMKEIEGKFQSLVDQIIASGLRRFNDEQSKIILWYFSLWYFRSEFKNPILSEFQLPAIGGGDYSTDEEEFLEKNGLGFVRSGAKMPARFVIGPQIYISIVRDVLNLKAKKWAVVEAHFGEFLVPDFPAHAMLPITPNLCIVDSDTPGLLAPETVASLNDLMANSSREFFFARSMSNTFLQKNI